MLLRKKLRDIMLRFCQLCTLFTYLSLLVLGCISLKPSQYQETIRRNITLKETGDTYR